MDRYLVEEREPNKDPASHKDPASTRPHHQGSQDVEMESIRSSDHGSHWEYDPDDVDWSTSVQTTVATAATGATGSTMIQRVRISAISDLKEFTGKDQDEDRARVWISKVKSALMRDQASDDEKCLTFAGLLAGSAKNWYRQLNLAERLTLLRLTDADDLEEVLRARDRAKNRQKKVAFGSSKYRQKASNPTPSAPAKQVRAIQIQGKDSGSDGSGGSDSDVDSHRKIFLAANEDVTPKMEKEPTGPDPRPPEHDQGHPDHNLKIHGNGFNRDRCSHCGSRKHSDLGCWRRVTCT
ncbi:hypothetical protein PHMEG_00037391, partial [Phytophthora megakarya]